MYLNILPNLTNSYFEEGNGTLRNLISGTIKDVPIGTGASADGSGNISEPAPPARTRDRNGTRVGMSAETLKAIQPLQGTWVKGTIPTITRRCRFQNVVFDEKPVTDIIGTTEDEGSSGGSAYRRGENP
jgi:hypothetical protein